MTPQLKAIILGDEAAESRFETLVSEPAQHPPTA